MDKRIDEKTREALIKAFENVKTYNQQLKENKEKRLWKKVNIPCSLYDAINGLTKAEIDVIRKDYDFKNLSSLKKADLALELSKLIPLKFASVIHTLDQSRYDLIKMLVENSGYIPDMGTSISEIESLLGYSILFPGIYDNERILFIPNELNRIFSRIDRIRLESIIKRNTQWINITHGLLYYYGVISPWQVTQRISELTGQEVDILEFMSVMSLACDFYGQVGITLHGYKDERVFDASKIVEEHRRRPGVEYYPFTKRQLLEAGNPGYCDRTPKMNKFINFLLKYYNLSEQEKKEIPLQISTLINMDSKLTLIIEYLQSLLEFPSFEFVQQLTGIITELYNNTRQWSLKGHTPNELFMEERKHLKPLPPEPFEINKKNYKIIDMQTCSKVGRNDPCPCGSGKKFKKCCGK